MNSRSLIRSIGFALLAGCLFPAAGSPPPTPCAVAEDRGFGGAYRLDGGAVVSILPSEPEGHWRIRRFDSGRSHRLHPAGANRFRSAADWASPAPAVMDYRFELGPGGQPQALVIQEAGKAQRVAKRIPFRERSTTVWSGETELFGTLTLPASGTPPFKTVVFVHGSDPVASVGLEWLPHLLASNGVATFVFDKRGTGCSKGQYVQHVDVLANDVLAVVERLKRMPEVDPLRIGLAGFSQGGWVAPLAALKDRSIRFVAVGYGMTMSMADEDRLEAPLKLGQLGVSEAAITEFQDLNAALHQVAREGFKDWTVFERKLDDYKSRDWLALAQKQPSWVGIVLQMGLAQAKVAAPQLFANFFQPFYEPLPTLEQLDIPMLWMIAEQDIEAPPGPTLAALARLRQQGKAFKTVAFPRADHGLIEFELRDGQRVATQYAEGYFSTLVDWIRSQ